MPLPDCELIDTADLEPGVEYAVQPFRGDYTTIPMRPCCARLGSPDILLVRVPEIPQDLVFETAEVHVLGRWDDPAPGETGMTWRQLAAHLYGEVLRHNELVRRLDKAGITRSYEPYLITPETPPAAHRNLHLNYDELDELLTKAGIA